ncbi:metal ABC transporter permease [Mycobacterium ahvazicum]|uniref:Metal ABC transporter permease n=1 Tax=Mycobacterium ahvazicum TaxID=1964395 RepID=A0A2K4Y6F4_9MYCO|nr:metal ABC transporter permease [Mycobacterium ahvazicum]SOX52356.1 metal ABC transporter permease [Mycobacterium ahvazicum]
MPSTSLSVISGMFIGGSAGYLGSLMLSRRMALVAGPLGHLTLPGIALALVWGFDVSLGAFPFVILGVVLIWLLGMRTQLSMEALTAVVFASGVAIAFLFLPVDQAEAALVGDISKTGWADTALAVAASIVVIIAVNRAYPKLVLGNISEELAAAEGIDVRRYNLLYLFLIAVVVALGVKMVGGLLTAALVAIPPAAARNVGKNLRQYTLGASATGVLSAVLGIVLFRFTGLPAGPLIVLVSAAVFVLTLPFAR